MALRITEWYEIVPGKGPNIWLLIQALFGDRQGFHDADFTVRSGAEQHRVKVRIDAVRRTSPKTYQLQGLVMHCDDVHYPDAKGFTTNDYNPDDRTGALFITDDYMGVLPLEHK